jgi:hypothetical protein
MLDWDSGDYQDPGVEALVDLHQREEEEGTEVVYAMAEEARDAEAAAGWEALAELEEQMWLEKLVHEAAHADDYAHHDSERGQQAEEMTALLQWEKAEAAAMDAMVEQAEEFGEGLAAEAQLDATALQDAKTAFDRAMLEEAEAMHAMHLATIEGDADTAAVENTTLQRGQNPTLKRDFGIAFGASDSEGMDATNDAVEDAGRTPRGDADTDAEVTDRETSLANTTGTMRSSIYGLNVIIETSLGASCTPNQNRHVRSFNVTVHIPRVDVYDFDTSFASMLSVFSRARLADAVSFFRSSFATRELEDSRTGPRRLEAEARVPCGVSAQRSAKHPRGSSNKGPLSFVSVLCWPWCLVPSGPQSTGVVIVLTLLCTRYSALVTLLLALYYSFFTINFLLHHSSATCSLTSNLPLPHWRTVNP